MFCVLANLVERQRLHEQPIQHTVVSTLLAVRRINRVWPLLLSSGPGGQAGRQTHSGCLVLGDDEVQLWGAVGVRLRHAGRVPRARNLGLRVAPPTLCCALLLLLQLFLSLVDERVQHGLDVLVQVGHRRVVLALGDEEDVADVRQARHHVLLQLLHCLRLLLDLPQLALLLPQLLLVLLVGRDARQTGRVAHLLQLCLHHHHLLLHGLQAHLAGLFDRADLLHQRGGVVDALKEGLGLDDACTGADH
mmetsp:Transcript_15475/g.33789  ORF Transcript_15475/g.33789 Transcript_15475/m.33789 type:complete len:248 (+) Transcript_15475:229-972(+)